MPPRGVPGAAVRDRGRIYIPGVVQAQEAAMLFTDEITDSAKAAEIKDAIRNTEYIYGVTEVTIGEHPEHGPVVLIQTAGGALLVRVRRPETPAA